MKLYYTPTSPFVRKVRVLAHELGLAEQLELVPLRPSPLEPDATLSAANPLSKIPALVPGDGPPLYDSRVICEWLHARRPAPSAALIPAEGEPRWRVLRQQALCDGILDAGILVFYERAQRPEALQWAPWLEGQAQKVNQGLDALEAEWRAAGPAGPPLDLAAICAGVTLGWLLLRAPVADPRAGRPHLAAWWEAFSQRASMRATAPEVG